MYRTAYLGPTDWPGVLQDIHRRAQEYDISGDWPTTDIQALDACGAMRWSVPKQFGGDELPPLELHLRYEELATASVATALILTQRDSAVGLVAASEGAPKRSTMLGRFAENKHFTTVGIAQLTTSHQRGAPALRAKRSGNGYQLDGVIPWCTGAAMAHFIVAGAVLDDGQQILFLMEPHLSGVTIEPVMQLVALRSTFTTSLRLKNVMLDDRWLLRGPSPSGVLGRRNSLTLGQTFLAMGLTRAAMDLIAAHDSDRARAALSRFDEQLRETRDEVLELSQPGREDAAAAANARVRGACNDLALRAAHTAVTLYKGTALLADHPAQRLAREALFLLVWSCPNPVIDCTVELLSEGKVV
jgi:alkylation response protein AidB-like acyl-CoA dehydrogenase